MTLGVLLHLLSLWSVAVVGLAPTLDIGNQEVRMQGMDWIDREASFEDPKARLGIVPIYPAFDIDFPAHCSFGE